MKKIYDVHRIVEQLLIDDPMTRENDNILYISVCRKLNPIVLGMDFETVMRNTTCMGIPSIKTVERCRRKLQETHPALRSSKKVEDARYEKWKEVMDYVSSE